VDLLSRLRSIRHVALDMDGTIYKGGTIFDFTLAFLARLGQLGIGYTLLTNNSSKSVEGYLDRLHQLGIKVGAEQLYTSSLATIDYLKKTFPNVHRLYVVGTASLCEEFARAGFSVVTGEEEPEAVIIGFDTDLTYARLCKAAWWIQQGKPFIATHPDRVCPTDQPTILVDCGSVCACLEYATGCHPVAVLGKPDPCMLMGILKRHGLQPGDLAMVGDRLYTDIVMARRTGAVSVLVLTGEATKTDVEACPEPPDIVVPSLREFGDLLEDAKGREAPD